MNITTILNNLASTQVKIVMNETPTGVGPDGQPGTVRGTGKSGKFKDFSDWIKTLDYASGHANARSDVIVVDTWVETVDPAASTASSWKNKVGYLRDGLHFTPYGARKLAGLVHDRLTAVYGSVYTGLASKAVLPVSNGASIALDTIGAVHGNFIHTNPLLTPGSGGTIQGGGGATFPLASALPQGWIMSGQGTGAGITIAVDKTGTDPDGYPMTTITVSGTLADASAFTLAFYQQAQQSGQLSVNDKLRGVARVKVEAGSRDACRL